MGVQVLIMIRLTTVTGIPWQVVKDTVRIGFLQTSKNWESLEVVIEKKLVVLKALSHRAFFLWHFIKMHIKDLYYARILI